MNENIKNAEEALKRVDEVSYLIVDSLMGLFRKAIEISKRIWETYKNTDHYKKKLKHMKRVRNREKLYKKRMAKYGRY